MEGQGCNLDRYRAGADEVTIYLVGDGFAGPDLDRPPLSVADVVQSAMAPGNHGGEVLVDPVALAPGEAEHL